MQTVTVFGHREPTSNVGQFLNSWQDPLATAGQLGNVVGQFLQEHKSATYALTALDAVTSPFMFAAREVFKSTEFAAQVMDNVAAIAGEIMAEGTAYVNNEAQIHGLQKSSEMVGRIGDGRWRMPFGNCIRAGIR